MPRLVENPDLAFRLARAIVSDIALYNQDKVASGIKNDNLFDVLAEQLEEGREHFQARVSPDLAGRDHLYERAIVDVMIKQAGKIESAIW
ncbi:hypothetical protein SAMN05660860_02811 [Geoalkalibacter ferrihydriticus]|uniref:Uncharacterized protein n=2 Tax=Geoalkalibacter ferrihydriticus TaxID=392333 RepID=A0A0C2HGB9_9BACT|nr:hypothetical protein [Geoalkalibacter ferrihydriticus]KIH75981.1 hypothetical protein GFER_13840 [Geoalkalibacter ferrihydriticus DSM 17813]SDM58239.1 hypothetical protein SAMN05660860_02811 [Geoalkalibacter ferrihydriticus]